MAGKKHIIVGAGTAGINAVRTLRQLGNTDSIQLVSAEPPYSRMVLPYFIEGGISEAHTSTATRDQLEAWQVETHFGQRAQSLDTAANKLTLSNGEELIYDDILIATGSAAVKPPIEGVTGEGIHTFWTLDDALAVHHGLKADSHVVMVGAGFIAFTILNGILARAGKVSIVELESRILPRMIDDEGAALVTRWLQDKGVALHTGCGVTRIEQAGGKRHLSLDNGQKLAADLVLVATGITANLDWLKGSAVEMEQGILVNEQMQSSVPNVYAAGDVAQGRNRLTGAREVHAIEPTAMEHGRIVGANMAGRQAAYPGSLIMNIVGVSGLDMASFGAWDDPGAEVIRGINPQRSAYRKLLFTGNQLTGAIYVGPSGETWSGNDLGMLKGFVQSGVDLGEWKAHLAEHPFDLKRPYLATGTVGALLPETLLGQPSASPRA